MAVAQNQPNPSLVVQNRTWLEDATELMIAELDSLVEDMLATGPLHDVFDSYELDVKRLIDSLALHPTATGVLNEVARKMLDRAVECRGERTDVQVVANAAARFSCYMKAFLMAAATQTLEQIDAIMFIASP